MPPLRVDPALLGLPPVPVASPPVATGVPRVTTTITHGVPATTSVAPAATATASSSTVPPATSAATILPHLPPEVKERPPLAPTYSAHATAGLLRDAKVNDEATYVVADKIYGVNDKQVIAEGNADLRKQNRRLTADKVTYWETDAEIEAIGNVRLTQDKDYMEGPYLRLKTESHTGYFDHPNYVIKRDAKIIQTKPSIWDTAVYPGEKPLVSWKAASTGSGSADRLDFEGKDKFRFTNGNYSTCTPPAGQQPDWYVRADDFALDYSEEEGEGRNATVYFQGRPILYSPWLNFSLNNKRKSGLLTPHFGSSTLNGLSYAQPLYWNIAPERDATFTPRFMSKRGTAMAGEFRYLDRMYAGSISAQVLPQDKILNKSRDSLSLNHLQNFGNGFSGNLIYNSVSDYSFLSDMNNSLLSNAQINLLRQGSLSYGGSWWSTSIMAQSYATLQNPALAPITEPYKRLPQITLAANRSDLPLGGVFNFASEYVHFRSPSLTEATRITTYPQLSLPLVTAATYVTPKIGFHTTSYDLTRQTGGIPDKLTRSVPIMSVDSGITFERSADWFGKSFTQTLEPRLNYLYVPVRDQNRIPVFDTGLADFSFGTIFAENRYGGGDRIGDANQLTSMIMSRMLDTDSGAELVRGAVGQRVYFATQQVGLPATANTPAEILRTHRQTDFLASLSGRVAPHVYADTGIQYNPRLSQMERQTISARYQPDAARVLNTSYRYARDQLGQIDVSGQWPIKSRWNAVGRVNYSTREKRLIENLGGIEYDEGCWAFRVVLQQFATASQTTSKSLFFQLELKGLSSIGMGDVANRILKRNIPGYGIISSPGDTFPGNP